VVSEGPQRHGPAKSATRRERGDFSGARLPQREEGGQWQRDPTPMSIVSTRPPASGRPTTGAPPRIDSCACRPTWKTVRAARVGGAHRARQPLKRHLGARQDMIGGGRARAPISARAKPNHQSSREDRMAAINRQLPRFLRRRQPRHRRQRDPPHHARALEDDWRRWRKSGHVRSVRPPRWSTRSKVDEPPDSCKRSPI